MKFAVKAAAAVLSVLMLLSVCGVRVSAQTEEFLSSESFTYTATESGAVLTKYTGDAPEVAIPQSIGNLPVTQLGEGLFSGHSEIVSVIVPEGVISILDRAFEGCTALRLLSLPDSLEHIGRSAFSGCSSLTFADLPEGIKSIDARAFEGCSSLKGIFFPTSLADVGEAAFLGCTSLEAAVVGSKDTKFAPDAFGTPRDSLTVAAPEAAAVRSLAGCKFITLSGAEALEFTSVSGGLAVSGVKGTPEAIIVPEKVDGKTVTEIASLALARQEKLFAAVLPNSIKSIDAKAFSDSRQLVFAKLPTHMKNTLSESIFDGCSSLSCVNIPEGIIRIEDYAFRACTSLDSVIIPSSVSRLGSGAFTGCSSLSLVVAVCPEPELSSKNGTEESVAFGGVPENMKIIAFDGVGWSDGLWWPNGLASFGKIGYEVEAIDHKCFCRETVVTPVGCGGVGHSTFECAFCGDKYDRLYPPTDHLFVSLGILEDGVETFRCRSCTENYLCYHIDHAEADVKIDRTASGAETISAITLIFKGTTLVEGTDFTLMREYDAEQRRAKLHIDGAGEYVGSYDFAYDIATGALKRGYMLTVEGGVGSGLYYAGDIVSVDVAEIPEGYKTVWSSDGVEFTATGPYGAAFRMPQRDVRVSISFAPKQETEPPETTPPVTEPPETTPPETTPPETTPPETTEPSPYDKTPEGQRYMKMFVILGAVLGISLVALILVLILSGKKGGRDNDNNEEAK